MGHQRRVIAVDGAWGVEQNNSVILVSGKKILTPISFHIIINNMKWSINGIYEGIESYMYQIQLLRAIRAKQE